jgi:hypothetical protein
VSSFEWLLKEAMAVPASPRFVAADETWQASIERVVLARTLRVYLQAGAAAPVSSGVRQAVASSCTARRPAIFERPILHFIVTPIGDYQED